MDAQREHDPQAAWIREREAGLARLERSYDEMFGDGTDGSFLATFKSDLGEAGLDLDSLNALSERFWDAPIGDRSDLEVIRIGLLFVHRARAFFRCSPPQVLDAVASNIEGMKWFGIAQGMALQFESDSAAFLQAASEERSQRARALSERTRKAAMVRHERDPKRLAKERVRDRWDQWREKPHLYASVAEFARLMVEVEQDLESTDTVEKWHREWRNLPKHA